jgi:hypothetical protein
VFTMPSVSLFTYVGGDFQYEFHIEVNGIKQNLQAATCFCDLRMARNRTALKILNPGFTITKTLTDNTYTKFKLSLTDTQTASCTYDKGYFDFLVVNGTQDTFYLQGDLTFIQTVSRKDGL